MDPEFFDKNEEEIKRIQKKVSGIIVDSFDHTKGNGRTSEITPLESYRKLLINITNNERDSVNTSKLDKVFDNNAHITSNGIRSITQDNTSSNLEQSVIQSFGRIMNDTFALIGEYRNIVQLVPELKKVLKIIVSDTINVNEVTKRALIDVYKDNNIGVNKKQIEFINRIIETHIIDKYNIERKQAAWIMEAFVAGAKPIAVLSYTDIVEQALMYEKEQKFKMSGAFSKEEFDNKYNLDVASMSREELSEVITNKLDLSKSFVSKLNVYKPKIRELAKYKATEEDKSDESIKQERDLAYGQLISIEAVDKLYDLGLEELMTEYQKEYKEYNTISTLYGTESVEANTLNSTLENIEETIKKITTQKDNEDDNSRDVPVQAEVQRIKDSIREKLEIFVNAVDDNIEVVKDDASNFVLGYKQLNKEQRYRRYFKKDTRPVVRPDAFDVPANSIVKTRNNSKDKTNSKIDQQINNITEDRTFNTESLILDLDPECVIPVTLGSEHIGYYIFEYEAMYGSEEFAKRRTSSFTEMIKSTGYGTDKNLIKTTSGAVLSPSDPASSSMFNPLGIGFTPQSFMNGGADELGNNKERIDILKEIVIKTITMRLEDPDLIDNKRFKDAIMNLIRNGYIINKQVQFTFVPVSNMVYFAADIDDKGIARSILDGTLLIWYMYLSSLTTSLMIKLTKSSDTEKLEVNMGMSGQMGMTLQEIQKNLSTRNVHMKSFFDNVGTVLKNSAVYQRLTVPVFDGEKLYDISPLEKSNDYSIDDDYTSKLLQSGLATTGIPSSIINMLNENEYSRSIIVQNSIYRDYTIDRQRPLSDQMTKLIKILVKNAKLPVPTIDDNKTMSIFVFDPLTYNKNISGDSKDIEVIDYRNIEFSYKPSMTLNVSSMSETFSNVESLIDNFIKYYFGDDIDDSVTKEEVKSAKRALLKMFANNVDFDAISQIIDSAAESAGNDILEKTKKIKDSAHLDKLKDDNGGSF